MNDFIAACKPPQIRRPTRTVCHTITLTPGLKDEFDSLVGPPEVDENSPVAFCKLIETEAGFQYYIKYDRNNQPYNPLGQQNPNDIYKRENDGDMRIRFKPVSREQYHFYMNFLQTKNEMWLRHTDRGRL